MGLPKAVIEAAKKAEELSKKLEEKPEVEVEEEVVDDEPEIETDDTALGEEEVDEEVEEEDGEPEEIEVADDDEEDEEEEITVEDKSNTLEYWKERFLTIQGKYNAEIPRYAQQVRELQAQLDAKPKQESDDDVDTSEVSKLKPEDFEDYGEEFITLVKAVNALDKRNRELESLAQSVTTQSQVTNLDTFKSRLAEIVPDWKTINDNQDFITWLQEPDGYSGMTKHEALLKAYNQFNSDTVGKIFNQFKAEFKIPIKKNKKPKKSLSSEVEPKSVKTQRKVTGKKVAKVWTRQEIADFYRKKTDGKIDPKKAARLEKDIFLANQEGRIAA